MEPILLPMDEEHIEDIAKLEAECFSSPWSYDSIKAELSNPNAVFVVALMGDKVVGYMGMHNILGEGYICNIAVSSNYRKMGVGSRLIEGIIYYAKNNKMLLLTLEVRASNFSAIDLYTKKGFEILGERKDFYIKPTENALIMTHYLMEN